ncbi:MAG: tRNA adenosine(34) deaminase TadA [Mariprofundaceae bacterium]|nr:tRNA adenosine(34) deaminase TadA [Mariprofundaceae bacterium]
MNHEYYMQQALEQAALAAALGEVPVGAVLRMPDERCFLAHNAPISHHDPSAHAEVRVIREASQKIKNYRLGGGILYVTLEPCLMCAGLMVHARIDTLVYAADDRKTGAVKSLYRVLHDERLNHQVTVIDGILADASSTMIKNFFRRRRR